MTIVCGAFRAVVFRRRKVGIQHFSIPLWVTVYDLSSKLE
jgi:hypothetical protein